MLIDIYRYQTCRDCAMRAYAHAQSAGPYSRPVSSRCADGQDGLCAGHRVLRATKRTGWRTPTHEGQE